MIKLLKVTTNKQPKTEFWMQACFTHLNTNSFLCRKHWQKQTNKITLEKN